MAKRDAGAGGTQADGGGAGGAGGDPGGSGTGGRPAAVNIALNGGIATMSAPLSTPAGNVRLVGQKISVRGAPTCLAGASAICLSGGITP